MKRFREDYDGFEEYDEGKWVLFSEAIDYIYQEREKKQYLEKAIEHYQELTGVDILKTYEDNMDFLEFENNHI